MKTISAIVLFVMPLLLFAGGSESIIGIWQNEKKTALIKIYKKNNRFHGAILKMCGRGQCGSQKLDANNPDESLRKRELVGLVILKDLLFDGDSTWGEGSIYDPSNGKTYRTTATLSDDGNILQIHGFLGISLFGRTEEWTRFKGELK